MKEAEGRRKNQDMFCYNAKEERKDGIDDDARTRKEKIQYNAKQKKHFCLLNKDTRKKEEREEERKRLDRQNTHDKATTEGRNEKANSG